jgi:multicomponent Na+:H+ antiporter subunit E
MTVSTLRPLRRWSHHVILIGWLTTVWLALWGDLNGPNILGGLVLVTALVVAFPPDRSRWISLRPFAAVLFVGHFLANLTRASARLVAVVLRPGQGPTGAVIAVDLNTTTPALVTVISLSISLTPGTLVLDTLNLAQGTRIYVHILNADRADHDRADIAAVERLAIRAFGPRPGY